MMTATGRGEKGKVREILKIFGIFLANYVRLDRKIETLEREIAEGQVSSLPTLNNLIALMLSRG
jgi:hypothetical protein